MDKRVVPADEQPYETSLQLEERCEHNGEPCVWAEFDVRWDGCVNAWWYFNSPKAPAGRAESDDVDQLHICDLRQHIADLQEVLRLAEERFGKNWPND